MQYGPCNDRGILQNDIVAWNIDIPTNNGIEIMALQKGLQIAHNIGINYL
jgi:hypothetical protein